MIVHSFIRLLAGNSAHNSKYPTLVSVTTYDLRVDDLCVIEAVNFIVK